MSPDIALSVIAVSGDFFAHCVPVNDKIIETQIRSFKLKYYVESGDMQIIISADDSYTAAVLALSKYLDIQLDKANEGSVQLGQIIQVGEHGFDYTSEEEEPNIRSEDQFILTTRILEEIGALEESDTDCTDEFDDQNN